MTTRVRRARGIGGPVVIGTGPTLLDVAQKHLAELDPDDVALGSHNPVPPWTARQIPKSPGDTGTLQTDRLTIVGGTDVPGLGQRYRPTGQVMRVELRDYETSLGAADGDVTNTGGSLKNRTEVYGRMPADPYNTPPAQWDDPPGSERWYSFSIYVPSDFTFADDPGGNLQRWMVVTQWHGLYGLESPPLTLNMARTTWRINGSRTDRNTVFPNNANLDTIQAGQWTKFIWGIKWSTDPAVGWVEVWINGVQKLARTYVDTMDVYNGDADPMYLKQGIYRNTVWDTTAVLHYGPMLIGEQKADVE